MTEDRHPSDPAHAGLVHVTPTGEIQRPAILPILPARDPHWLGELIDPRDTTDNGW